jgi:hypothetical protein
VNEGKATSFNAARRTTHRFGCPQHPLRANLVAMDIQNHTMALADTGIRGMSVEVTPEDWQWACPAAQPSKWLIPTFGITDEISLICRRSGQ